MSGNSRLQALREKFTKAVKTFEGSSQYFPFFTAPYDSTSQIRFIADKNPNNPLDFLQKKKTHTFMLNGRKTHIPCLSMYRDANGNPHKCPACELSREFYNSGDKVNGKIFYASTSYIAQALIETTPVTKTDGGSYENEVRLLDLSPSIYNIIKSAFESGEDLEYVPYVSLTENDDPTYAFRIKRTLQGEHANYTTSRFAARPTMVDDDLWKFIVSNAIDLSTVLPANPGVEKMENAIEAVLSGRSESETEEDEDTRPKFKPAVKKVVDEDEEEVVKVSKKPAPLPADDEDEELQPKKPAVAAKKPAVVEDDDDDEDDAEAMRILEDIRKRRNAAGK